MNNIVILTPEFPEHLLKSISHFYIEDLKIPIGIMKQDEIFFSKEDNKEMVLVKKDAFSCNYRDKAMIVNFVSQINRKFKHGFMGYSSIGSEFVGTVIEVGEKVVGLNIGDRVIPNAQYPNSVNPNLFPGLPTNQASKRVQSFNEKQLIKIPDEIPNEIAASITIIGHTVYSMVEKAKIEKNKNVLITSLKSNTSIAIAKVLLNKGCNLWGITTSNNFVEKFKELGIKNLIVTDNSVDDFLEIEEIKKFVIDTGGFDAVFDPFADLHLGKVTSCMNMNSKYITCGVYDQLKLSQLGKFEYVGKNINEIMIDCIHQNISIIGNCLGQRNHLDQIIVDYLEGNFDFPIDSVITGNDIAYFFDRTFKDPDRFGKVVYKYDD